MVYLYIILGLILLSSVLFVTVPIKVIADYADGDYRLQIRIFGINIDGQKLSQRFSKKGNKSKKNKQQDPGPTQDESLIDKINSASKLVRKIKSVYNDSRHFVSKRFFVDDIYVNISFGTWDAALTGIATGAIWALLYDILGLLTTVTSVNNHKFSVDSVYDRSLFDIKAGAVCKFSIVGVAGIAFFVLYNLKKYKE